MTEITGLFAALLLAAQAQATPPAEDAPTQTAEKTETAEEGAAPPPATAPERTAEQIEDDQKVVCKRQAVVGSKFKKRICATKEQWRTLRNRSGQETANMQRRMRGFEPGG